MSGRRRDQRPDGEGSGTPGVLHHVTWWRRRTPPRPRPGQKRCWSLWPDRPPPAEQLCTRVATPLSTLMVGAW